MDPMNYTPQQKTTSYLTEFLVFGLKQAWACLFGGLLLFFILMTHYYYPLQPYLYRYDFLFLVAVGIQIILLAFKLEKPSEAVVIIIFHLVATGMEIFKTSSSIGSWSYPEPAYFKIAKVPLFAGFMYSAVGSYIARSWRVLDFKFNIYPSKLATHLLAAGIYLNFFTHHYIWDFRWELILWSVYLFGRTWVTFTVKQTPRKIPLILGWLLVALFIWFAENIGTFTHVWLYPLQKSGWHFVSPQKIIAWYLVIIISFVWVSLVHSSSSKPASISYGSLPQRC
jgi:uncharacterized membrane protein YoaT (DUF817 family)